MELGRDVISNSHVNNMDITLINGAKIYVRGSDRPDTLRGVSLTFLVLDEVADIKSRYVELRGDYLFQRHLLSKRL